MMIWRSLSPHLLASALEWLVNRRPATDPASTRLTGPGRLPQTVSPSPLPAADVPPRRRRAPLVRSNR